jgi:hypothetical protein
MRTSTTVALLAACGIASGVLAQVTQLPIGATLRYEVANQGGPWSSMVAALPGEQVEFRAVLSYTGTDAAVALGRIFYQPVISGVDNLGSGTSVDQLGAWRNGGVSGQGTTLLAQGLLSAAEGASSNALASYGRVRYGFTSRSTVAGNSGGLTGHRHSGGSAGAPAGDYIRMAGSFNTNWYPSSIPNGTVALNNQILWGVVSDNNTATSTWYTSGTQNIVLFRQAFIMSSDSDGTRFITFSSEAATLQRAGGGSGTDDTRFMTWALAGEGGSTASVRVGVEYVPAFIFIPSPGVCGLAIAGACVALRRRR